jgi:adenosine deaminase
MEDLLPCFETGYFRSLDLYGDELAQPPEAFKDIYRAAANAGIHLKAHVGEFGDAASVRHTVEVLELEQVQHGIAAAASPEVMRWLSDNHIQLNVCPTSNVMLGRALSIATHPMRTLFDHGVKVTVNTDDLMIFDQSINDEYFNLFDAGLFAAEELDLIRVEGLKAGML